MRENFHMGRSYQTAIESMGMKLSENSDIKLATLKKSTEKKRQLDLGTGISIISLDYYQVNFGRRDIRKVEGVGVSKNLRKVDE